MNKDWHSQFTASLLSEKQKNKQDPMMKTFYERFPLFSSLRWFDRSFLLCCCSLANKSFCLVMSFFFLNYLSSGRMIKSVLADLTRRAPWWFQLQPPFCKFNNSIRYISTSTFFFLHCHHSNNHTHTLTHIVESFLVSTVGWRIRASYR